MRLAAIAALAILALAMPFLLPSVHLYLVTEALILGLFATSLNLLVGGAGVVSFGHALYFGLGAYGCGLLMKQAHWPFVPALLAGAALAGAGGLVVGALCVRVTQVYFAMLTLAFAQVGWAVVFRWSAVTGGDQGMTGIPYPGLDALLALPGFSDLLPADAFYWVVLAVVSACLALLTVVRRSAYGLLLAALRDDPRRVGFLGVSARAVLLLAFVLASALAGVAGGLSGIFSRGLHPDIMYWTQGAQVLIVVVLGGAGRAWGPFAGAFLVLLLHQELGAVTDYWGLALGLLLGAITLAEPGGLVAIWHRLRRRLPGIRTA